MHDIERSMFETGEAGYGELGETELGEYEAWAGETTEVELATELLEVTNEEELDRFLGSLLSSAAGAASRFASSDTGRQLGGILKGAAKKALPVVGRGIGGAIDPRLADVGGRAASALGSIFGLELEGLSHEDREFETARAFVRFATDAAQTAAAAPPQIPPPVAARRAVQSAARRHAPGLVRSGGERGGRPSRRGRWERQGSTIVLYEA